jgi:hypothetical protein
MHWTVLMLWLILFYRRKCMFNAELRTLLVQVITSWQVLAVTVVIIIYFSLVSYVARIYLNKRPRSRQPFLFKRKKKDQPEKTGPAIVEEGDDLGLEEKGS